MDVWHQLTHLLRCKRYRSPKTQSKSRHNFTLRDFTTVVQVLLGVCTIAVSHTLAGKSLALTHS